MSTATQTPSSTITIQKSQNVLITNKTISFANTEESHGLQSGLKQLLIRNRYMRELKIYFLSGSSHYITIPPGANYEINEIDFSGTILYMKASGLPCVVEIQELY